MLLDLETDALGGKLEADVCIVGGGPAGISIARELAGSRYSVLLLESGGLEFEPAVQQLYEGPNPRNDFSLAATRFRLLGGTTNVWGGWCAPLDEIDFTVRDWVPHSGWPISRADLVPYYRKAQGLCELGPFRYTAQEWPSLARTALPLDPDRLEHRLWQLSPPTRFGPKYVESLRRAANITVVLHANAVEVRTEANARSVRDIGVASLGGRRTRVRARAYVLACGGIEIPRLMLASNRVESTGLANGNDLVGRYFMEHPHPDAGGVALTGDVESFSPYSVREIGREGVVLAFGPSERAQRRLRLLNSSVAVHDPVHHEPSDAWDSLMKLSRAAGESRWPENAGSHVAAVLRDLDEVLREGWRRVRGEPVRGYTFTARTEVAPNPLNRVTLTGEKDALGMPRARLDWKPGVNDRMTVASTMKLLAQELGRLGVGRVRINDLLVRDDTGWSENLAWYGHHMGTTRMNADPRRGVVDADCRVHGIANLFIASSSVFPTSGFANPTLTILALALKLAEHLKTRVLPPGA